MTRAPAALLLSALTAYAGVAPPPSDPRLSCPAVIKNAITLDMLTSDGFLPWDVVEGAAASAPAVMPDSVRRPLELQGIGHEPALDEHGADQAGGGDTVDTLRAAAEADTSGPAVAPDSIPRLGGSRPAAADAADTVKTVAVKTAAEDGDEDFGRKPSWIKRRMKFGRRAAFNQSQVTDFAVRIYTHDGESFLRSEYRDRLGFGIGFEAAGVIELFFSEALALNFSPGVVFSKPINTAVVGTSEAGLSFPLLLEWGPFGAFKPRSGAAPADAFAGVRSGRFDLRRLRLFGGIWAGAPLFAWVKWNGEAGAPFKERASADFGLACGAGVHVSDRAFVDARVFFGLTGYDRTAGHRLNQAAIGVNYVK